MRKAYGIAFAVNYVDYFVVFVCPTAYSHCSSATQSQVNIIFIPNRAINVAHQKAGSQGALF